MSLESINKEIDALLLECFECYEESKKINEEMIKKYGDGLFNLARARVALLPGGKITQDEYDMRMKATVMVTSYDLKYLLLLI
jgi:hypothetical protein